jgi:transcriptional regulator with XRE-family HTH domain
MKFSGIVPQGEKMKRSTYLQLIRQIRGYSIRELGRLSEVNMSTLCRWEEGSRNPRKETIFKISKILEIDPDILLYENRIVPEEKVEQYIKEAINNIKDKELKNVLLSKK